MSINDELEKLTSLYDVTAEKMDNVYSEEIEEAIAALREKAPYEYEAYLYWFGQRKAFQELTEKTLKELELRIKAEVAKTGETCKSELFTWVFQKGRESWNTEMVKGFLLAHNADVDSFMKRGEPSVSCRRNKKDIV